jgi:hypothetical protein
MTSSPIRNVSDTARWAVAYRARENERSAALFRDPFARRLAGELGEEIANTVKFSTRNTWSWLARAVLKFAPAKGPAFFDIFGWHTIEVRSLLKTPAIQKRLPLFLRLMAPLTPEVPTARQASRPWGGVASWKEVASRNQVALLQTAFRS